MFADYLDLFRNVEQKAVAIRGLKKERSLASIIRTQQKFINGLSDALESYFDGHPARAYEVFKKTMNHRVKAFKTLQTMRKYESGQSFYRLRIKEENHPLSAGEMFHIPFQLRGRVSTQRYSIPGFPSLYLAGSLYVAWEELKRPNLDRFQAVRLATTETLTCLDLTRPELGEDPMHIGGYRYLMIWPLIAACSIKVANPGDSFKPEYILPQLLLQWVRNNGEIDGIIYASTNIQLSPKQELRNLYNVVLPVKDNKDKGLCSVLCKKFSMTQAVSRQLLAASSSSGSYLRTLGEIERIDNKIPRLEIISGRRSLYSSSEIGKLEMVLDEMSTTIIAGE